MCAHAVPSPRSKPPPPPSQRVLFIPELVDIIFNLLDRKTNVTNALVCKQWSQLALDVVWKVVDDLLEFFRLLKPIRVNICKSEDELHASYGFKDLPDADDWLRFKRHASRVRCLCFHTSMYSVDITPLLDEIARTRTSLEILPNMHTLEWIYNYDEHMERSKIFLHRKLRHLIIAAPCKDYGPRPSFYRDLCARAPHLHTLDLMIQPPGEPHEDEVRILLRSLPELRKIVLPEFHFTSSVIEEISRAKNIRIVEVDHSNVGGRGNPKNVETFAPVLTDGAFPSLLNLGLVAKIDDLDRFFRSNFAPINITTLYINTYEDHSPSEVHDFLVSLSQQCHLLSKLNIQLLRDKRRPIFVPENQFSYETIKPLLTFPHLLAFKLMHKYPLKITLDEIEELASQWPSLESLMLNVEPGPLDEDAVTLNLRALLPFARHCPRLWKLGLYMNATEAEIPAVHSSIARFRSLQVLSVGSSQVGDPNTVAAFLSRVCPSGCVLDVSYPLAWSESDSIDQRNDSWEAIEELFPVLIEAKKQEKDSSGALREEVEDLRTRNPLLIDQGHINPN